jgi:hypothetical protein
MGWLVLRSSWSWYIFQSTIRPPFHLMAVASRWYGGYSGKMLRLRNLTVMYHFCLPWGGLLLAWCKTKSRAGIVRPSVGIRGGGGRTPPCNSKKRKHGRLRFLLPLCPRLRPGAAPPPLSRWNEGFATGTTGATFGSGGSGESKPNLFSS